MAEAALSLGSNLGDKEANIRKAIRRLGVGGARVSRRSALYRTEPWGDTDQDWFLNCCVLVETALSAHSLLQLCHLTEKALGRDRSRERRWGPRTVDIDLLTYDEARFDEEGLIVPHPRMLERAFVLVPLNEIAPNLSVLGQRVGDAVKGIDVSGVEPWKG